MFFEESFLNILDGFQVPLGVRQMLVGNTGSCAPFMMEKGTFRLLVKGNPPSAGAAGMSSVSFARTDPACPQTHRVKGDSQAEAAISVSLAKRASWESGR